MLSPFFRIILIFTLLSTVAEILANPLRTSHVLRTAHVLRIAKTYTPHISQTAHSSQTAHATHTPDTSHTPRTSQASHASRTALYAGFFDLAGTVVDEGCKAPTKAFIKALNIFGINLTENQARMSMGKDKLKHLEEILAIKEINNQWLEKYGRAPDQNDIRMIYEKFLPIQKTAIEETSQPIRGVKNTLAYLKRLDIQVGFNTGYPREMTNAMGPFITSIGSTPESIVCADEVKEGRPSPDMLIKNASDLGLADRVKQCFAVGDTPADIQAANAAGMWSIGVALTGNETGLNQREMGKLSPEEMESLKAKAYASLNAEDPNFVIDGIWDIHRLIPKINILLANGHEP